MADTEQVTSQTPATRQKNPKRVAAGKAIAQKNETGSRGTEKGLSRGPGHHCK